MMRTLSTMAILVGMCALPTAAAAVVPDVQGTCTGIVGCASGPVIAKNMITSAIPLLSGLMIMIASGASVFFIAWAGLQMVLAMGNDGKLGDQKWAVMYVLGGLAIAILSQTIVTLVGTEPNLVQLDAESFPIAAFSAGIRIILTIFNGVLAVVIIIAGIRMVYAQGKSDEFNTGRKIIFWCIIGAVVTNLANALVQALARIFGV